MCNFYTVNTGSSRISNRRQNEITVDRDKEFATAETFFPTSCFKNKHSLNQIRTLSSSLFYRKGWEVTMLPAWHRLQQLPTQENKKKKSKTLMILTAKKNPLNVRMLTKKLLCGRASEQGQTTRAQENCLEPYMLLTTIRVQVSQSEENRQLCPSSTVSTCQYACPQNRQLSWGSSNNWPPQDWPFQVQSCIFPSTGGLLDSMLYATC